MTSQDLVRNKRHVEVLAARAELLVQIAGDNQRLRSELNSTLAKAYSVLDLIRQGTSRVPVYPSASEAPGICGNQLINK